MTTSDFLARRLHNQQISQTTFERPEQVVAWLGAMQSQEYAQAKWAIGLRLPGSTEEAVEKAFQEGQILRTHILRPTWHFIAPADIRWMLLLSGPRVQAGNKTMYRREGLEAALFSKCYKTLIRALEGQHYQTRTDLQSALQDAGIEAAGQRLAYIIMQAELDGLICSGPRIGKQFSYALLEERVAPQAPLNRQEALVELVRRYFSSRGPATLQDFSWWSGLTLQDAKTGVSALGAQLHRATIDQKEYIFPDQPLASVPGERSTFLMPDYDEYGISYKDRSALFPAHKEKMIPAGNGSFQGHLLVVDGVAGGLWQRNPAGNRLPERIQPFFDWSKPQKQAVDRAVERYTAFMTG